MHKHLKALIFQAKVISQIFTPDLSWHFFWISFFFSRPTVVWLKDKNGIFAHICRNEDLVLAAVDFKISDLTATSSYFDNPRRTLSIVLFIFLLALQLQQ